MGRYPGLRTVIVFAAVATVAACTGRSEKRIGGTDDPNVENRQDSDLGGKESRIQTPGDTVDVRYPISGRMLQQKYDLDLDNLRYKFTYRDVEEEDKIEFENGEAELEFNDLPVGVSGTVWLKIYEGGTLELQAEEEDFKLEAGKTNRLTLTLEPVGESGGDQDETTDLIIDVTIDEDALQDDDESGGSEDQNQDDGSDGSQDEEQNDDDGEDDTGDGQDDQSQDDQSQDDQSQDDQNGDGQEQEDDSDQGDENGGNAEEDEDQDTSGDEQISNWDGTSIKSYSDDWKIVPVSE